MSAPKLVLLRSEKWDAIWIDYLRGLSFTALAEAHGVSRRAIGRHAQRHGWEKARRIERARRHIRQEEEGLAFARSVGIEIARHLIVLCRDRSATLATLDREAKEAHLGVWDIGRYAALLARARDELRLAEAGDPDAWCKADAGFPTFLEYDRPTRWPEYEALVRGYRGGRPTATVRAFKAGKLRLARPATA